MGPQVRAVTPKKVPLGDLLNGRSVALDSFRQATLEFARQKVHILFIKHRFVAPGDFEHTYAATDESVPTGIEIPILPVRPVGRLKKYYLASVSLRSIDKRSWVHDRIQILQMLIVNRQTQGMAHSPIANAGSTLNTSHAVIHVIRQFLPTEIPKMMSRPLQQQLSATLMCEVFVVCRVLSIKH